MNAPLPTGQALGDFVVGGFPLTAFTRQVTVDGLVHLHHESRRERHMRCGFVDQRERVAVARDFLFGAIARDGVVQHNFFQLRTGCLDAFDAVGRLGGFDARGLAQCRQSFRSLLAEKILLPAVSAERMHRGQVAPFKA